MVFTMQSYCLMWFICGGVISLVNSITLSAEPLNVLLTLNETAEVIFTVSGSDTLSDDILVMFNKSNVVNLPEFAIIKNETKRGYLRLKAKALTSKSYVEISGCQYVHNNATKCEIDLSNGVISVTIIQSKMLDVMVHIVGWLYFFAWSISFYPQIILNIQRKSVVGLNFDFLLLNVIGFAAYTLYNCFMYFSKSVQEEYLANDPRSPIPVLLNDVVFAIHALFACLVTVAQCVFFEKGAQRVSKTCLIFGAVLIMAGFASGALAVLHFINALAFIQFLSFIKMVVTLSKYFPQAVFNFQRKSTVGWSIGNVLLDFTGGFLDIVQMVLQAINANDWSAFIGNPVKFGLGLVSIIFDILFIIQHYALYRDSEFVADGPYSGISGRDNLQIPQEFGSRPSQAAIIEGNEDD